MGTLRGKRGKLGDEWSWQLDGSRPVAFRSEDLRRHWTLFPKLSLLVGLFFLMTSFGGGARSPADHCNDASLQVKGQLAGTVSWCAPQGTQVTIAVGIIAVHYPGNENPCNFAGERGPGDAWFEVPGSYQLVLTGPSIPGEISSAEWTYGFQGSFSLCGGENAMRVTIVLVTNLAGATGWVADFGPGAFGARSGSFAPASLPTPTPPPKPTPTSTPTQTPPASPTPGTPTSTAPPSPTATPPPSPSPTPTTSGTPTPSATPGSPTGTAAPVLLLPASATPRGSPATSVTPTAIEASVTPGPAGFPNTGAKGGPLGGMAGVVALLVAGGLLVGLSLGVLNWTRRRG